MIYDHILVRYGELTLKGANRKVFVSQLRSNVKRALMPLQGYKVKANRDRMYIELDDNAEIEEIMERFARAEKSRTSEGNGLGLSIADSFTKNCGGDFGIEVRGDQFRVEISFQKYTEKVK